jgi:hypothetical protein
MAALGAAAGLAAAAGGMRPAHATLLGFVLAVHAAVAVPLVRPLLRRRGRALAPRAAISAMLPLGGAASLVTLAGHPLVALAFAPRALQVAVRLLRGVRPAAAATVGAHEALRLAAALLIVTATL